MSKSLNAALVADLPVLHPIEFRNMWGLSNAQAAIALGVSERSIYAYASDYDSYGQIGGFQPHHAVLVLTALRHQSLIDQGFKPATVATTKAGMR